MKVFKTPNFIFIKFSDGQEFSKTTTSEEVESIWNKAETLEENQLEDLLLGATANKEEFLNRIKNSSVLTLRGNSIYMLDISELSIPEDFAEKILEAEESGDTKELLKYKNFWTLISLNPDSRVRNNIFWFIRKWDMQISESGFIIGYRNATLRRNSETGLTTEETKDIINHYYKAKYLDKVDPNSLMVFTSLSKNPISLQKAYDEAVENGKSPVYTDCHSHTTEIRLGQPVSMPREKCDAVQENSCSRGLHVGSKGWLKQNYFGEVGMQVLVNPAKIVAIPTIDDYGKMRCCEYLPVALIDYDENGDIIEPECNLYNDIKYLQTLSYEGEINNEDLDHYAVELPISREEMYNNILKRLAGNF